MEGQTDPILGPFWLPPGVQKNILELIRAKS